MPSELPLSLIVTQRFPSTFPFARPINIHAGLHLQLITSTRRKQPNRSNGAYQGEQYEAIGKLKNTNFGRVTILGGPDAGKSTLGIEICNAVLAGPPQAHCVKCDSLPLVQTSIVDGAEDDNEDGSDGMKGALKWPGTDQIELIRAKINEVDVDMQETMETEDFPAPHDDSIIGSG